MKAILLGASGLIGSHLLNLLLQSDQFEKIIVPVRKKLSAENPKLEQRIVDFSDPDSFKNAITPVDVIFCCIGTTQKKVKGDKVAYRKIDYDIPIQSANYAYEAGIKKYILVSAIGANAKSKNFYLQLKGEVENAIASLLFETLIIMQPSVLIGQRTEKRTGEKIAQILMPLLNPLLIGWLKKYRPVKAKTVANAMLHLSHVSITRIHKFTYKDMIKFQ